MLRRFGQPEPAPPAPVTPDPLRPQSLDDFHGQSMIKARLRMAIAAANARTEPMDHVLLYGPAGLGKTSLAGVCAAELGGNILYASGMSLKDPLTALRLLRCLKPRSVLFIDEIHRLKTPVAESMYTALEDYRIDYTCADGKVIPYPVPPFTMIGATTHPGKISEPMRDRCGLLLELTP